jgi:alkylation response protein AidB-like acyl-CoA dehydrogenase
MTTSVPATSGLPRDIFEDEHDAFRESVHGFLMREAVPHTEKWEQQGLVDRSFWTKAAAQGFVGFEAPEEHGGAALDDWRFNAILNEEVAYTGTVYDNFSLTNDIALPYLLELTTEEQRARWLPGLTSGEVIPAIAMSEPGAGSDLRAIASTATWRDDHWVLTGSKTFVTNGILADLVIVAARVRGRETEGLALFVVQSDMDGFQRGRKLTKIGRRAQDTAELFFESVPVPPGNMIGEEGKGLHHLMRNLAQERLSIATTATANAERALEITLEHVRSRNAFGKPVGSFQANRFSLADLSAEISIVRAYTDRCIAAHARHELDAVEAAKAKLWSTELEFRAVDLGLQLHGGYGYMEEYEIARRWRDARVERIYGGTSEIMKEIIGRSLGL